MKAILINPEQKAITEVEYDDSLSNLYEHLDCGCVDTLHIEGRDVIFIDDNGLSRSNQSFFAFRHYPIPLAGRGLVLGTDKDGSSIAPEHTTVETLERDIHWITRDQAIRLAQRDDDVKQILAKDNPNHIVIPAADIIRDAEYSEESKQGE